MEIFIHDGSFEGFLSALFYSYEHKIVPDKVMPVQNAQRDVFANTYEIVSDKAKANRIWQAIVKKSTRVGKKKIYRTYLSECPQIDMLLFNYLRLVLENDHNIENDYAHPVVVHFNKVYQRILKEAHRVSMFTRFQRTADDLYFAGFEPEFNVLPLATVHFKDRFADQRWVIYDLKRKYGFYYDKKEVVEIRIANDHINSATGKLDHRILAKDETFIQKMWGRYYQEANIEERKNDKQHQQLLPKKYWKYLPEKDIVYLKRRDS
jgi:probable DNA metabolism protein